MTSNFLLISVMLHFSLAVGFYSAAEQGHASVTQEIELITLPPMEKKVEPKAVVKKSVAKAHAATAVETKSESMPSEETSEANKNQQQTIAITGSAAHPYIRHLWKSLLNKKRDVKNKLEVRNSYLVKMKILKSGLIQEVNILGPDQEVIEELKTSLVKEPQVRSIPDDLSKDAIQVQYTVSI